LYEYYDKTDLPKLNIAIKRPLHDSVAKEKSGGISLIETENEANNELLASF